MCALLAFDSSLAAERMVLGHQMLVLPRYGPGTTIAQMNEELDQWSDLGIDVLAFDQTEAHSNQAFLDYLQASTARGVPVRFAPEVWGDSAPWESTLSTWKDADHAPARLLVDGKPLYAAYYATPAWVLGSATWAQARSGEEFYLVPNTSTQTGVVSQINAMFKASAWAGMPALADWSIPGSIADQGNRVTWFANAAAAAGKKARVNVVAHYKPYAHKGNWMATENWGYTRMRESFRAAINAGPAVDAIEFLTLNDMSESSYINSWAKGDPVYLLDHWNIHDNGVVLDHSGFRYFAKRYVQWFETGIEPAITEDELYYAYRLHPRNAESYLNLSAAEKTALQKWRPTGQTEAMLNGIYRKDPVPLGTFNGNDPTGIDWSVFSDAIHVAVRLTAPADVYINGVKVGDNLPAGEHLLAKPGAISEGKSRFEYAAYTFGPVDYGYPHIEVRRGGEPVFDVTGEMEITPYALPGCWNMLARRVTKGRASVALSNIAAGQYLSAGVSIPLDARVAADLTQVVRVEFFDGTTRIGEDLSSPFSIGWTPSALGAHSLTTRVITTDGASTASEATSVIVATAPATHTIRESAAASYTFTSQDIGGTLVAGSSSLDTATGEITAVGGGANAGQFRYLWRRMEGDCTLTARVAAISQADVWSLAGVMLRDSLRGDPLLGFYAVTPNGTGLWECRLADKAYNSAGVPLTGFPPQWVRLTRTGNTVTTYRSADGNAWTQVGTATLVMDPVVYVGLFVSANSGAGTSTATARFTNVSMTGTGVDVLVAPRPAITAPTAAQEFSFGQSITVAADVAVVQGLERVDFFVGTSPIGTDVSSPFAIEWTGAIVGTHTLRARAVMADGSTAESDPVNFAVRALGGDGTLNYQPAGGRPNYALKFQDIGATPASGDAAYDPANDRLSLATAGGDIWSTADTFRFLWREFTGDGVITTRVDSLSGADRWAKAGVMIRSSLSADAAFVATFCTPQEGVAVQLRRSAGAAAEHFAGPVLQSPLWVRLERRGNLVSSSVSGDGQSWIVVGRDMLALGQTIHAGIALSSHDIALPASATLGDFAIDEFPAAPGSARLASVSTRGNVGTGDNVVIAGFVVSGSGERTLLVRGIGPTLAAFGVNGLLPAVSIQLNGPAGVLATAPRWGASSDAAAIAEATARLGAFPLGAASEDSVLLTALTAGAYTAFITGRSTETGIALVEVYDATTTGAAGAVSVQNLSSRGRVGTGENVLIAGFAVEGDRPARVLVRAVGPTLGAFGTAGALADPQLILHNATSIIAVNDDWQASADAQLISGAGKMAGAFPLPSGSLDAALVVELPRGIYTAEVSGKNGATGLALVELYQLP